ncbi:MAG: glycosyltransferase [Beijerinckiaceae bacterium]|nr:glycosyltransferase [Beijerinckiaceae bacterium]
MIESTSYTYLFPSRDETAKAVGNFIPLPLVNYWQRYCHTLDLSQINTPNGVSLDGRQSDLLDLMDLIQCFHGHDLDMLEIPDYLPFAAFVPAICKYLNIKVGRFVLSMHGTLSMALADNWLPFSGDLENLRYYEDLLVRVVDLRYGIGARYVEDVAARLEMPVHLLDPGQIFQFPKLPASPKPSGRKSEKPDLVFIGRQEKWKGPDVFLDIVSKLDRSSFGRVRMFGPPVSIEGVDSTDQLKKMAAWLGIDISFEIHPRQALIEIFQSERLIAVFPSRLDTFNLSALEALLNGCPCIISTECGVLDYLHAAYPGIPHDTIGTSAASDLATFTHAIDQYDERRTALRAYLKTAEPKPCGERIDAVYSSASKTDVKLRDLLNDTFGQISWQFPRLVQTAKADSINVLTRTLATVLGRAKAPTISSFVPTSGQLAAFERKIVQKRNSKTPSADLRPAATEAAPADTLLEKARMLFDADWYLDRYRDVGASGMDPFEHYMEFGARENRKPNAAFDGRWYLETYPDVVQANFNPLVHYAAHGAAENRRPHPDFDPGDYRARNKLGASENALLHFLKSGGSLHGVESQERAGAIASPALTNVFQVSMDLADDVAQARTIEWRGSTFAPSSDEILKRLNRHNFSGDRVAAYRFAAELERKRGNDVLCATYNLRAMRLSGTKDLVLAESTAALLERSGYVQEAQAARLLYGDGTAQQIFNYLSTHEQKLLSWAASEAAEIVDRRTIDKPRVSIIVSVYNGVNKIGIFLETLKNLTAASRQTVDLVIVDSNSLDGTGDWIKSEIETRSTLPAWLSIVYVRSRDRETIQKAWNRGIQVARGKYFSFMGVDESNRADAYDRMADYLDANPSIDWVVSDAVVQDVDMSCAFVNDIMIYRRQFETKDDHLLECCYMSYVGCLYRADIHKRFGYYDETFRAAGDTEFKNRLLRRANFGSIDECLGFFTNYPEERVTQSPLAELEDLRAWYLHRSLGGLMFRFEKATADEIIALFIRSLDYKKSYMDRRCTDLELAANLAALLKLKFPVEYAQISQAADAVEKALAAYRLLDRISDPDEPGANALIDYHRMRERIIMAADMLIDSYDQLAFLGKELSLDFISDNRSHQHNNMWASVCKIDVAPSRMRREPHPRVN